MTYCNCISNCSVTSSESSISGKDVFGFTIKIAFSIAIQLPSLLFLHLTVSKLCRRIKATIRIFLAYRSLALVKQICFSWKMCYRSDKQRNKMNLKPRNTEKSDIFISSVDYLSLDSGLTLSLSITLILYLYYECFPVFKVPILMLFWCSVLMLLQVTLASLIFLRNLFEVLKIMKKICTHIFCIVCASFWPCSCGVRCHGSQVQVVEASQVVADVTERLSVVFEIKTSILSQPSSPHFS